MSGMQVRPVVVGQESKLQKIEMGVLEGPSSQPVTITPFTEVNGILTGLPSQASTIPTIRYHLRSTLLLLRDTGDLVVTSPWELVEIPRTLVRFTLSCAPCMSSPGGLWAGTLWAGKRCECYGGRLADSGPRGPIKKSSSHVWW